MFILGGNVAETADAALVLGTPPSLGDQIAQCERRLGRLRAIRKSFPAILFMACVFWLLVQ
jgi:hypothetical protein